MAIHGDPQEVIGVQMLKALGLPTSHCSKLVVSFEPGDVVRVTAEYVPSEAEAAAMVEVVQRVRDWA
jgi:hypothetical protein